MKNMITSQVALSYKNEIKKEDRVRITMPENAFRLLIENSFDKSTIEHHVSVKAILLNVRFEVLGIVDVSEGGINESPIDIRVILQAALLSNASSIMLARNSPSGSIAPSVADKSSSNRFRKACEILGFSYNDFLIITSEQYYSFADEGLI